MLHFAMHAAKLLVPLVRDKQDAIWKCLLLHLQIFTVMSQHAITRDDVDKLAMTIHNWQKLFLSIPEYKGLFKPKGHFYSHFPIDILQFGPTRLSSDNSHFFRSSPFCTHLPFTPSLHTNQSSPIIAICSPFLPFLPFLRQYWCMRFEGLNQFFKRVAVRGSFRDTLSRCRRLAQLPLHLAPA